MKVIGGIFKNRNFYMPEGIRPTQNMARKALFDLLGQDLQGLSFLDLFSGSGAVGLEALSRGADPVALVEKDLKCVRVIEENVSLLIPDRAQVTCGEISILSMDAFAAIKDLRRRKKMFDLIFIDPPYRRGLAKKALKTLGGYVIFNATCQVIVQTEKNERLPQEDGPFFLAKRKVYGASQICIYEVKP